MNDSNWITDPKGNRITNKDVSERIEKNNSKINDLKNRMKGRSKADNFRDTVHLRDLENENNYFQERFMKSGYERNEQSIRALFSQKVSSWDLPEQWNPLRKDILKFCESIGLRLGEYGISPYNPVIIESGGKKKSFPVVDEISLFKTAPYDKMGYYKGVIQVGICANDYYAYVSYALDENNAPSKRIELGRWQGTGIDEFIADYYEIYDELSNILGIVSSDRKINSSIDEDMPDNYDPFKEGYDAYMRNDQHCPYKQGTEEFDSWVDGWQEAEMDMEP